MTWRENSEEKVATSPYGSIQHKRDYNSYNSNSHGENPHSPSPSRKRSNEYQQIPIENRTESFHEVKNRKFCCHGRHDLSLIGICLVAAGLLAYLNRTPMLVLNHDNKGQGGGVQQSTSNPNGRFKEIKRASYNDPLWNNIFDKSLFSPKLLTMGAKTGDQGGLSKPFPTGAFWTNLVVLPVDYRYFSPETQKEHQQERPSDAIVPIPYAYKWHGQKGLLLSYPAYRRSVEDKVMKDYFYADMTWSCVEGIGDRHVVKYDSLSVTLRFYPSVTSSSGGDSYLEAYLVQGSPYSTIKYKNVTPKLTALSTFSDIGCLSTSAAQNGLCTKKMSDKNDGEMKITGVQFLLTQQEGQRWILFASEPLALTVEKERRIIWGDEIYTGVLRLALIPPDAALGGPTVKRLMSHSGVYPVGGKVVTEYQRGTSQTGGNDIGVVNFVFDIEGGGTNIGGELLMLALPHHKQAMENSNNNDGTTSTTIENILSKDKFDGTYSCIKGNMTAIIGNSWSYTETLTDFNLESDRTIENENMVEIILRHLATDATLVIPTAKDVYGFGKQISRMAQLAHLADVLKDEKVKHKALETVHKYLTKFLDRSGNDRLVYDGDLGGVVSIDGLRDPNSDFGNGRYSDHHFHYGYIIYASSILSQHNTTFIQQYGDRIDALVSDISNDNPTSSSFPVARHKSWYNGHSWASGLFPQGNGKSQESSSEAVNAYYAVYLWSLVRENEKLSNFSRLLLAMEIRGAKNYWHIGPDSIAFDEAFTEQNYMVGNLGGLDVTSTTWFGTNPIYVHLINVMPITSITEELFDYDFVSGGQYDSIANMYDTTEMSWKGQLICNHAIIDPELAWEEATQDLVSYQMDSGLSLSQVMYWIGTRPYNFSQFNLTVVGVDASCEGNTKCVGLTGDCCPTTSGTYLECCD
mmetsp:Transcript_22238/g.32478  ORF Transcript_22238/g.32478 Transcript_22238/m.32478 type:complete len:916 (-) Transcript_22238:215-2962(-)|eukprot:CAMPEP_0195506766 /NCGR_PEP_ID=MMETSP0794_2-20130614/338_1 /TAXON_ID=515487 /ORGANISM="Stephanopyxis turris, Strain CCMP 815" /LENGTH=915 /DNA_ID=CAMNT_0040633201 /DNA_START=194 /DNA_END=2941 /DNA_ORIENTATION=+